MARRTRGVKCCGEDTGKHRECTHVYQANSFEMVPQLPAKNALVVVMYLLRTFHMAGNSKPREWNPIAFW